MIQHSLLLALSWGTLSLAAVSSIDLPAQLLPVFGGSGGTAFSRSCGAGKVLTGLRGREGQLVDAVGLLCRPVNSDGSLGSETTVGTLAGGGGGNAVVIRCKVGEVVIGAGIFAGSFVDGIKTTCRLWIPKTRTFDRLQGGSVASLLGKANGAADLELCESTKQPAHGIRGRAAVVVDAIGFTCDEP